MILYIGCLPACANRFTKKYVDYPIQMFFSPSEPKLNFYCSTSKKLVCILHRWRWLSAQLPQKHSCSKTVMKRRRKPASKNDHGKAEIVPLSASNVLNVCGYQLEGMLMHGLLNLGHPGPARATPAGASFSVIVSWEAARRSFLCLFKGETKRAPRLCTPGTASAHMQGP